MKKCLLTLAISSILTFEASIAFAQSKHSIAPKVSSLGVGAEYMYHYSDQFSFGAGAYGLGLNRSFNKNKVNYDGKVQLFNLGAFAQYNPWDAGWVSGIGFKGGLIFNDNKVTLTAKPSASGSFTFNNQVYTTSVVGKVDGKATTNQLAPYLGVTWSSGDTSQEGLAFTADVGVMFSGKPKLSLNAQCNATSNAPGVADPCPSLLRDIEAERKSTQQKLDKFKVYPVASVGLIYRF